MTETPVVGLPLHPSPEEQTYPTLTAAQVARVASYGRVRRVAEGEVLIEAGSQLAQFFVVVSAPIAITIIGAEGTLIKVHQQGGFAGENLRYRSSAPLRFADVRMWFPRYGITVLSEPKNRAAGHSSGTRTKSEKRTSATPTKRPIDVSGWANIVAIADLLQL
jgi:hypothetical protein